MAPPLTLTAVVAADGTAVIRVQVRNGFDVWTVTQVSTSLPTAPIGATCTVQLNGYPVSPAIATGDAIGGDPPVTLRPSDLLTVSWAGCNPGGVAQATVFYDDGR